MAILVTNSRLTSPSTDIQTPLVDYTGVPGDAHFAVWFTTGYDENTGVTGNEKTWNWLKDVSGTKWIDANANDSVDTGEISGTFSASGDDDATIVNTLGSASGWHNEDSPYEMLRDSSAESPLCVYFAADFDKATEIQSYTTNSISVEIYHP